MAGWRWLFVVGMLGPFYSPESTSADFYGGRLHQSAYCTWELLLLPRNPYQPKDLVAERGGTRPCTTLECAMMVLDRVERSESVC